MMDTQYLFMLLTFKHLSHIIKTLIMAIIVSLYWLIMIEIH